VALGESPRREEIKERVTPPQPRVAYFSSHLRSRRVGVKSECLDARVSGRPSNLFAEHRDQQPPKMREEADWFAGFEQRPVVIAAIRKWVETKLQLPEYLD